MLNWPQELQRPTVAEALDAVEAVDLIVTRPSLSTVYTLMRTGRLPAIRIGRRLVTSKAAIEWMESQAPKQKHDPHAEAVARLREEGVAK